MSRRAPLTAVALCILVTPDGIPKLLDFGLAKLLDRSDSPDSSYRTVAGMGAFTPEYASPEQVRLENITTASDIYSLGVVLYELLTGDKASFEQLETQTPQPTQRTSSTRAVSSRLSASNGQASTHIPQPLHITWST